ncbi:MAG TPA: response regulator transcription factor [Flavipsychrobacter sp.]|nr:response regulator transcription factor [Chitinophagales bacterium]HLO70613.1 response regulator transcription factor [Flavipsychrobacter sp.]
MATNILLAEDEAVLGKLVKEAMENKGFAVQWAKNGSDALQAYKKEQPDICILDVMMPGIDGFTLAKQIRAVNADIPILFLTARSQTSDVLKGYESGGNDYLRKPFSLEELYLRINELLRRTKTTVSTEDIADEYKIGKYTFLPQAQLLSMGNEKIKLSNKETLLLQELVIHKNKLMERRQTLIKIWGDDNFFNGRNMDVYIAKLRKHLAADASLSIINVRGHGFKLVQE